jgi:RsiW-degrading membrane proteinase PrsW (M82 family)
LRYAWVSATLSIGSVLLPPSVNAIVGRAKTQGARAERQRMRSVAESTRIVGLLVAGLTLAVFGTPLRALWSDPARAWWLPYALWALAISVLAWLARPSRS